MLQEHLQQGQPEVGSAGRKARALAFDGARGGGGGVVRRGPRIVSFGFYVVGNGSQVEALSAACSFLHDMARRRERETPCFFSWKAKGVSRRHLVDERMSRHPLVDPKAGGGKEGVYQSVAEFSSPCRTR